jgi:trans-aconitate 2-methyltransferase
MRWDPEQYLRFADERARPFGDLVSRIPVEKPGQVVDLGCGPGTLTVQLADRWPQASVVGLDHSPDMVRAASALARPGLSFHEGDLRAWRPQHPVDVIVANAVLQWVPDHMALLPQLAGHLAPGGSLAFQVPGNFGSPAHVLLREQRADARWRDRLSGTTEAVVADPEVYLAALSGAGLQPDVWETTYLHLLAGPDAVLEWMKGTALRPVLGRLGQAEASAFLSEYRARLAEAYPSGPAGLVFPFRRIFAIGGRPD